MTNPVVIDESHPTVVRATLSDPATRNRLDDRMIRDLTDALDRAERSRDAQVFVMDATGNTFCAGLSLGDLDHADWRPRISAVRSLLDRLTASPLVTIAVVDGPAIGGGVGLAAACDQVIAGPRASFRMTEVLLGLIPALALAVISRRVGPHQGFALALTARELPACEAVRLGLADRLTGETRLELRQLLVQLRGADPNALRALKRYHAELFVAPSVPEADLTMKVLGERLDDPRVRERLTLFDRQGLIP
jgi:polyketide biosynthesis enoyl-CoA hydratase PksH